MFWNMAGGAGCGAIGVRTSGAVLTGGVGGHDSPGYCQSDSSLQKEPARASKVGHWSWLVVYGLRIVGFHERKGSLKPC